MIPIIPAIENKAPTTMLKYPVKAPIIIPYTIPAIFVGKQESGHEKKSWQR